MINERSSFDEIDVTFDNDEAGIKLNGTLTLPHAEENHTAAILVSGSGQADRDSTFLGHKPFKTIAEHLANHGVATLRFDKRGVKKSRSDSWSYFFEDP